MTSFRFSAFDAIARNMTESDTPDPVMFLLEKAYYNLHSVPIPSDITWRETMISATESLYHDRHLSELPDRTLIKLVEDMIRVSEEEMAHAERHRARAKSSLYLSETARDHYLQTLKQRESLGSIPDYHIARIDESPARLEQPTDQDAA